MKICTECFNFVVKGNVYRCKVKDWKIMGRPAPDEIAEASKMCQKCEDFEGHDTYYKPSDEGDPEVLHTFAVAQSKRGIGDISEFINIQYEEA